MTLAALPAHGRSDSGVGNSPSRGVKPDMPNDVEFTVTNIDSETAEVTATWNSVGDANLYQWESAYDTGENKEVGEVEPPTTSVTFQMPRSGDDEGCYFCVKAVNNADESENGCNDYTVDAQSTSSAPTAPSDLTATAGDGYVDLSWTNNSTSDDGAYIYRSTTQGFTPGSGNRIDTVDQSGLESYSDPTAQNGTMYYYRVKLFNANGESGASNEASATPTANTDWPNEPAGHVLHMAAPLGTHMEETCEAGVSPQSVTADGWTGEYGNYHGYSDSPQGSVSGCSQNNYSVDTSSSAPISSGWHRTKFPGGLSGGTTPGKWVGWDEGNDEELSEQYTALIMRWEDPGSGDWESTPNIKHGFWGVGNQGAGTSGVGNEVYLQLIPDSTPLATKLGFRVVQQNQVSRSMDPNLSDLKMPVGSWFRVECLWELNDIGSANGRARVWLSEYSNGSFNSPTKTLDYSDVEWRTSDFPNGFRGFKWDPTWGNDDKTRDDYHRMAHIRSTGVVL